MAPGLMTRTIHNAFAPILRVASVLLLLLATLSLRAEQPDPIVIFAAVSTMEAVAEAARDFEAETGTPVVVSHASSSALARQIKFGAPADLYLSANTAWLAYLEEQGALIAESATVLATNRLVVIAPADREIERGDDWARTLFNAFAEERWLALGDPDHVPAGIYARQALEASGLWQALEPRLARTADVRGALALVARGEVPAGIVYATDALISPGVRVIAEIDRGLHDPIVYVAALIGGGRVGEASVFLAYLAGPEGQASFARFGFLPPD